MSETQASGSSFYAAMRLLPGPERHAMFAIYGFCRKVDDIADEPGPSLEERRAALDAWRADLEALFEGRVTAETAELSAPIRFFGLQLADFLAVVDGMQMDVEGPIRAPPLAVLDLYCDHVASAVGRLSVKVFGMQDEPGHKLAHNLGRALQLTNILRDLDEDAALGRLYLPTEALAQAGIATSEPAEALADPTLDSACRTVALIAEQYYQRAWQVLRARPRGRLAPPRLMAAVYGDVLAGMEKAGWSAPRRRFKPGKARLAWLAVSRGLVGWG